MTLRKCTLCLIAVLTIALAACVQAEPTTMSAVGKTGTLLLTPSCASSGSSYVYSYTLENQAPGDYIIGFSLQIPMAVPVTDFTSLVTPDGWECLLRGVSNKVQWQLQGDEGFSLAPGQTFTFGFTSAFAPSATQNVFASSQDTYGYGGMTYGPAVPEPGSILALATGLFGLVGILKRK